MNQIERLLLAACFAVLLIWTPVRIGAQPEVPADRRQGDGVTAVRSARNISYGIDVSLDPATRTLAGSETITWRNAGAIAAYSIRLHMYWNAFRSTDSTWMKQQALAGNQALATGPERDFGSIELSTLQVLGADGAVTEDLMPSFRYISPSDQNADDRSLAIAQLGLPIQPGDTLRLRASWRARFPNTAEYAHGFGRYFFASQWFPKLGVFDPGGWNSHQFFATGVGYAEFGRYDVRLTVPTGWIVGATGAEQSRTTSAAHTTYRYVQDDVQDFAWAASPDFVEKKQRFEHPGLPAVDMRLLLQREHEAHGARLFAAAAAALRYSGEWFGRYPYGHLTIVDAPFPAVVASQGQPMLVAAGRPWLAPLHPSEPESAVIRGTVQQFWNGLVANNSVDHAWLGDGLTRYSQARVQAVASEVQYPVERLFGGLLPWQFTDLPLTRATDLNGMNGYRRDGDRDALATPSRFMFPGSDRSVSTNKAALMLHTLERRLGWDTMRRILATYFDRWRFRHPRPDDFIAVAAEVSGQDLDWFFDQVYRSSNRFDYAIERFESAPIRSRGLIDSPEGPAFGDTTNAGSYRTTVVARRLEAGQFPVDLLVTFANGEQARESWDGLARWQSFTFDRPVKAAFVQVDPERVLLLDTNYTNNSRMLEPATGAAASKWSLRWMVWLQDLMMTYSFFV